MFFKITLFLKLVINPMNERISILNQNLQLVKEMIKNLENENNTFKNKFDYLYNENNELKQRILFLENKLQVKENKGKKKKKKNIFY